MLWDISKSLSTNLKKHVFLPYGFAIDLNIMDIDGSRVKKFKIGDRAKGAPLLQPGFHSFDGFYTKMTVGWRGYRLQVESAAMGLKNVILISPLAGTKKGGRLVVIPESLWKRGNTLIIDSLGFTLAPRDKAVEIKTYIEGGFLGKNGKEFFLSLDKPVAICCGENMSLDTAISFMGRLLDRNYLSRRNYC